MSFLRRRIRPPLTLTRAELREQARSQARRARQQLLVLVPLVAGLLALYRYRIELFGVDTPVRIAAAIGLVATGWFLATGLARMVGPRAVRGLDPGTAGVLGFLLRLLTIVVMVIVALRVAGVQPGTLVAGASFTAVVVGLASQQTLGNIIAGVVLLSSRPFTIGDRVRFSGFGMDVEGTIRAHGLLYVTCHDGEDTVLIPNNTALTMSIRPIREPASVDMVARLPRSVDPESVADRVAEGLTVPTRVPPEVALEEFDGDQVVVRIRATPRERARGGALAREVLHAVGRIADGTLEHRAATR